MAVWLLGEAWLGSSNDRVRSARKPRGFHSGHLSTCSAGMRLGLSGQCLAAVAGNSGGTFRKLHICIRLASECCSYS